MKRQMRVGLFALVASMAAVACSLDDFIDFGGVIGIDDGASQGAFKSVKVDGSTEARLELKTGAALTIPKDAVEAMVDIGIERPADKSALTLVKSLKDYEAIVSAPYVLTPHGTKFKGPVSIELPVTKQTDKKLVMAWLADEDDTQWKRLGDPVIKDGLAKLEIDHFSVVILLEEDKANFAGDGQGFDASAGGSSDMGAKPDAGQSSTPLDAARPTTADAGGVTNLPGARDAGLPLGKDAGGFPFLDAALPLADAGTNGGAEGGTVWTVDASVWTIDASISSDGGADAGKGPDDAGADASQGPDDAGFDGAIIDAGTDAGKGPDDAGFDGAVVDAG